jgi:hypothetical protein
MAIVEIEIHKFEKLPDEAKEKAIERYWNINVDHEWWDFCGLLCDVDILTSKIISFDLENDQHLQVSIDVKDESKFLKLLGIPSYYRNRIEWDYFNNRRNLGTPNTRLEIKLLDTQLEYEVDNYTEKQLEMVETAEQLFDNLISEGFKTLQKEFDHLTGETAIEETLIANEYDFTLDGKIF